MDTTNVASRRSVLKGLGTLAAIAATVTPAIAAEPLASPELVRLAANYAEAHRRLIAADAAAVAANDAFDAAVKAANLKVPTWGARGGMRGTFIALDGNTSPEWVRDHIATNFAARAESAARARERQPEIAKWLVTPEEERAAGEAVAARAETVLAEWQRLFDASGVSQADKTADDAYEAAHTARKALFAYRPETMADVRAVARMLWHAAEETGRWTDLPARQFLAALCPDLDEA